MHAGDRGDHAQPQSAAGGRPAVVEADEALDRTLPLTLGNTGSGVADGDLRSFRRGSGCDLDRAARACVLDRVVEEIGNRLKQKLPVAGDDGVAIDRARKTEAPLLGERSVKIDQVGGEATEIDGLHFGGGVAGLGLGNGEECREGGQALIGLGDRLLDRLAATVGFSRSSSAISRRLRIRVSGLRRSWAISTVEARTEATSCSISSSMRFSVSDSRSNSSPLPDSGMRWARLPDMISSATRLMISIRPSMRRLITRPPPMPRAAIAASDHSNACTISRPNVSRSRVSRPTRSR